MPSSLFSCGLCLNHAVPHRWFRTVLVPQVRHLGIVTIDAQGILPEKKLVDSRCLRAPPASQQRVRSPEIQLAVGKLLRELRRQGPHAKRVNHQVSAAGRPKVGDVDLELQRRVRSAEGGRESYVPRS